MNAWVMCLCGRHHTLKNMKPKKCYCGVVLSVRMTNDEWIPYATIKESSIEERIRNNPKSVVYAEPGLLALE